jgi:ADP-ribose pyrophosphatase YjhB (NUDIX family)
MTKYQKQTRTLVAVDCIIFGFDGQQLKILFIQRGFEPEKGKWSLMGGFVQPRESADDAATRILKVLTGLEGVYLEQLHSFTDPKRDPIERTVSITYFALIDIHQYEKQLNDEYHAEWFPLNKTPRLIFDHEKMVAMAKEKLRYKASLHPLLFELLPKKFTLPQLQTLYEGVYDTSFDKRNFSRKVLSTRLLIKQKDKDKASSKKGAYYYKLNSKVYKADFQPTSNTGRSFLNIIPNSYLI